MIKKVFVGNLPWSVRTAELSQLLTELGLIFRSAKVVEDQETGQSRGFGFIEVDGDDEMNRVIGALSGYIVDGRPLNANEARSKPASGSPRGGGGGQGGPRGASGGGGGGLGGNGGGRIGGGGGGPGRHEHHASSPPPTLGEWGAPWEDKGGRANRSGRAGKGGRRGVHGGHGGHGRHDHNDRRNDRRDW